MNIIGVIPARLASTRLEAKVLKDINGQPMIQHVWKRAKQSLLLEDVLIACDHERVRETVQKFGARAVMTSPALASGTDRIAQAVRDLPVSIVLNIQGDEPLIHPETIDLLAKALLEDQHCLMATAVKVLDKEKDVSDPNVVKAVLDNAQNALYFSRAPIPFNRDERAFKELKYYKHLGIYGYRKDFLMKFKDLPPSALEQTEKLEQLRVLSAGYKIKAVITPHDAVSVDTEQDLNCVREILKKEKA